MGLVLVATGIAYFVLAGRFVLPTTKTAGTTATDPMEYLQRVYEVGYCMNEMLITKDSALVGKLLKPTLAIFAQIKRLNVRRYQCIANWCFNDGKDRFAECARLGELSKTPFGVNPVGCLDDDYGFR